MPHMLPTPPLLLLPQLSPRLLKLPQVPLLLLPQDMLVLADMLPTLPELSMLPRERPKLRPMLMLSMESMDMLDTHMPAPMVPTLDMLDTHMPMVHTLLMPTHTPMPHMLPTPPLLLLPQLSPRLLKLLQSPLLLLPQLLMLTMLLPQLSPEPPKSAHPLP